MHAFHTVYGHPILLVTDLCYWMPAVCGHTMVLVKCIPDPSVSLLWRSVTVSFFTVSFRGSISPQSQRAVFALFVHFFHSLAQKRGLPLMILENHFETAPIMWPELAWQRLYGTPV